MITSTCEKEQAIADLKEYKKDIESQKIVMPAALMRKVDEALTWN